MTSYKISVEGLDINDLKTMLELLKDFDVHVTSYKREYKHYIVDADSHMATCVCGKAFPFRDAKEHLERNSKI